MVCTHGFLEIQIQGKTEFLNHPISLFKVWRQVPSRFRSRLGSFFFLYREVKKHVPLRQCLIRSKFGSLNYTSEVLREKGEGRDPVEEENTSRYFVFDSAIHWKDDFQV